MNRNLIPQDVVNTLHILHANGFPDAIIAGGILRDGYFNQMFKDVDIFIHRVSYRNKVNEDTWIDALELNIGNQYDPKYLKDFVRRDHAQYPSPDTTITAMWDVLKNLIPYQIILTKIPPIEYVEQKFDFGLCKVYYDGTKVRFLPDFMHDARNQTLTLVGQNMSQEEVEYSMNEHLDRIQYKYPNFRVKVAAHNQKLVDKSKKGW